MKDKNSLKVTNVFDPLGDGVKESVGTTLKLVTSALTLVSALAWNEAIKGVFDKMKEDALLQSLGMLAPFVYAILVTILTVFIIKKLEKLNEGVQNKKKAKE